jgi:aspartate dehydrogenase
VKQISVIGNGRIGGPVVEFIDQDDNWTLASLLVRSMPANPRFELTTDPDRFFAAQAELIIDAAGPDVLRSYGERALSHADVWTVSGTALSDPDLVSRLNNAGHRAGHRMRLVPGAIGGLDTVSALACDPSATLNIDAERPELVDRPEIAFDGPAREGASRFGDYLNVAAASSLAGPGLDRTHVTLRHVPKGEPHRLSVQSHSRFGRFTSCVEISGEALANGSNLVAASIIAAMVRETQTIWAG